MISPLAIMIDRATEATNLKLHAYQINEKAYSIALEIKKELSLINFNALEEEDKKIYTIMKDGMDSITRRSL